MADEDQPDWAHRLNARAAITASEPHLAPSDPDVKRFRDAMPNGDAFTDQTEAIQWLRRLPRRISPETSPNETEEMRAFLDGALIPSLFGGVIQTKHRDDEGLRPSVPIRFDLWEGDPDRDPRPEDLDPEGNWRIPMGPFGIISAQPYGMLGELLRLGIVLERRYGWTPASARSWVVCSTAMPTAPGIRTEIVKEPGYPPTRIRLDLDSTIPPHRVRDLVRKIQTEEGLRFKKQTRALAPRNVSATTFAVRHNDGRSYADVCAEFNRNSPELAFDDSNDFAKRVRETYKTLMGQQIKWARSPGRAR